jgi:Na+/proline symporter
VRRAFNRAAVLFAIVPLGMSLLGFIAAGNGWELAKPELAGLETVRRLLPVWTLVPFTLLLLSGLASTLDSNLCAMASLAGHDFSRGERNEVRAGRRSMALLAAAALVIANVPGMQILYLFLFYGTLRAATFLPSVLALSRERVAEAGVFWGIVAAFGIGLPVFAYGNFTDKPVIAVIGSLATVLLSGASAFFWPQPGAFSEKEQNL